MGTRLHPAPGEPFCDACHMGNDEPCSQEHQDWMDKEGKYDPGAPFIEMHNTDLNKMIVTIHRDGSVELGEGIEVDEAARFFYDKLQEYAQAHGLVTKPEDLDLEPNAAEKALDAIAAECGVAEWDYPGQVVRDVQQLKSTAVSVEDRNQRLMKAIHDALPRVHDNPAGAVSILEEGMKANLPYEPDRGRTHYDGCWQNRGHHNCAVRRIHELQEKLQA
jgi:hypothetical protein